ncbi:class A sortase [Lysinibacillus pakistanensis]|uniref:Class A sortase n=1 Tax=Lysinibacillus pakistanensis TaxID=759811 RepID=A0AAX3WYZ8_9BACI|nr:class A sortase [Lysinibacillus pakistanensis]MDM5231663.1 class A sortase [Lysinibacillus pakistanensis]WHY47204.1 class A sortase [Lysinibacillus pakistanensis]WHY52213.1 class A sortase [Lysinibacillus pakistanensis]
MNKLKLPLIISILIVGLLLIFINPIQNAIIAHLSHQLNTTEISAEEIEKNNQTDADYIFEDVQSLSIAEVLKAQTKANKMPVIGSIAVPSVDMQLPIVKGVGNAALAVGAGTMKPNQNLGQGNYALAGHYFEEKDILFSPLYKASIGDSVYITDLTNIYEYQLTTKKVIAATDVYVIDDIPDKTVLTLITCADNGTKRLAIQADFIQQYPYDEAPEKLSQEF